MPAICPNPTLSHVARRARPLAVFVLVLLLAGSAAAGHPSPAAGAVTTSAAKAKAKKAKAKKAKRRAARSRTRRPKTYAAPAQPADQGAPRTAGPDFFGINPGDLFKLPADRWDGELAAIAASGIESVRMGAWWSDLEPAPPIAGKHTYSWSDLDERVAALARHGLRWEPLLCFSPTWGSKVPGDYTASPSDPALFAAFAAALTQRYGRGGSFWVEHPELPQLPVTSYELWNEQNAKLYWHPGDNAAEEYADLYASARSAMRQVDGAARVTVGGLGAPADGVVPAEEFLRRMFAHRPDLRGNVDAVGYHPYARDLDGVALRLAEFRRALDAVAGPGVPIAVTEIGWTTSDTTEETRAANIAALAQALPRSDCGVDRMMPYAWIGPEQDPGDREQWFGMRNRDGSPKPSATAYAAAVKQMRGLEGTPPPGTVAMCAEKPAATPPVSAQPAPKALKLALSVRQDKQRPGRVLLNARCAKACRLQVSLLAPRGRRHVRVAQRTVKLGNRTSTVAISVPRSVHRRGTRLRVEAVARAGHGRSAQKSRTVRLNAGPSRPARRL